MPKPEPMPGTDPVGRTTALLDMPSSMPAVYTFVPRRSSRLVVDLALLGGLAATAYLSYLAYLDTAAGPVGLAAVAAVATALVWAVRAGSSATLLTVRHGQLDVRYRGTHHVFDLGSGYTPLEVVGRPGWPGWKVRFHRRDAQPFVVNASMVDAREFMRVLRFYRRDL